MYAALLSRIGLVPLAVTTNLNINFLAQARGARRHPGAGQVAEGGAHHGGG